MQTISSIVEEFLKPINACYGFIEFMQYEEKVLNLDGIFRTINSISSAIN